jgi:hypothetical protein
MLDKLSQKVYNIITKKQGEQTMKKLLDYFELNRSYRFEIGDLTSLIYVICAIGVILGGNMTILFLIGSFISTLFCWQAKRLNLVFLNLALFAMNIYYFILLF